ncbi:hypothetical protein FPV67DRAFT_627866 [Lyophyllum atratum]|nr:hypothetical protein FPV67DRAFT_627866 [Lyophyllum atratum]
MRSLPRALSLPETSKQPRPPLTLRDMGKAPRLMNCDHRRGRRVGLKVLAFPFLQRGKMSGQTFTNSLWTRMNLIANSRQSCI